MSCQVNTLVCLFQRCVFSSLCGDRFSVPAVAPLY